MRKYLLGRETPIPGVNWNNMYGVDDQDGINIEKLKKELTNQEVYLG